MGYPAAHMPQPNMPPYPPQLPQLPQHTPWYMGLHESMQPVSMLPELPLSDGNPAAAAAMAAQLAASAMGVHSLNHRTNRNNSPNSRNRSSRRPCSTQCRFTAAFRTHQCSTHPCSRRTRRPACRGL